MLKFDVQNVCNLLEPYFGLKNNVATESLYEKLVDDYVSLSVEIPRSYTTRSEYLLIYFLCYLKQLLAQLILDLAKIKYKDILRFRELILKLPKRNRC